MSRSRDRQSLSENPVPPRIPTALLRAMLRGDEHEALIGDLLESFQDRLVSHGAGPARRRFWREALVAAVTFTLYRPARAAIRPGDTRMSMWLSDLRYGMRVLRRAPTFTVLCVLTLGLGIGATTAIFSLVNPLLLKPIDYDRPEQVVMIWERDAEGERSTTSFANFTDLARESRTIASAAAMSSWQATISEGGEAERLNGQRVSWTYFRTIGVRPALGRDFMAEEDQPDRSRVVILSHGVFASRFGSDPSVIGRTIQLDGAPFTVVGVMPASFENVLSPRARIWRVLGYSSAQPWACRTCRHIRMVARLRDGVTPATAAAELNEISARLVREYPKDYSASGTFVVPIEDQITAQIRPVLLVVLGAVAIVLFIAVANVASLQIGRAMRREDEFAIRTALGAGRGRLARQLLAEGLLLSLGAAILGIVIASVAVPALVSRLPDSLPRLSQVRLDWTALLLAGALMLALGTIIGLVPALRGHGRSLADGLRSGRRLAGGRHLARAGLVVTEVALALILLMGAGLMSRSMLHLLSVNVGFEPENMLLLEVQATGPRYATDAAVWANHDRILEAVRAVPGVVSAAMSSQLPLAGNFDAYGVRAKDKPLDNPELAPAADRYTVAPELLRTMRIPIVRGRTLQETDNRESATPVALVSASLARRIWPGEDAIGKYIQVGGPERPWLQVVGVTGDVHHRALDNDVTFQFYVPERQWPWSESVMSVAVRTSADPNLVSPAIRRAIMGVDPTQPIVRQASMERLVAESTGQRRLALLLFACFSGLAVLLAGAGIYGVLATRVAERTREIGVRTALGATPSSILTLVARQGITLVLIGSVIGAVGAGALTRFLRTLLFGVAPTDPTTFALVVVALVITGAVACVAPVLRAVRVDPVEALRSE